MLQYKMSLAMGSRDLLTSSGWRSYGQDRKVSVCLMSSRGRAHCHTNDAGDDDHVEQYLDVGVAWAA